MKLRENYLYSENDLQLKIIYPDLAWRLLQTGDKVLVEGNHLGDTCWGVDTRTGKGENHLGKILMKVREELKGRME